MMRMTRDYRQAQEFAALLDSPRTPPADHPLTPLVLLSRSLSPAPVGPSDEFRTALRERLVAEAAARPIPVQRGAGLDGAAGARPIPRRMRQMLAGATALVIATSAGAAVASTRALPGDALYGLKRGIEAVQLRLAFSDLARGEQWLEQAGARLDEAQRLVAADRAGDPTVRPAVADLLAQWTSDTARGAELLTGVYRETGDPQPIRVLERFAAEQREQLQDLLAVLDPDLREQVRAALMVLDSLHQGSHALLAAAGGGNAAIDDAAARQAAELATLLDPAQTPSELAAGLEPAGAPVSGVGGALAGSLGGSAAGDRDTGSASGSGGSGTSSGSGGPDDPVSDLVGGIVGSVTGPSPSSGLPGGSTGTATPLPSPTSSALPQPTLTDPLPSPSLPAPLPSVSLSSTTPTSDSSTLPSVSAGVCVPIPPLTTCP